MMCLGVVMFVLVFVLIAPQSRAFLLALATGADKCRSDALFLTLKASSWVMSIPENP